MRFQAAIVGGGPAGAVAALVLARRGVRVAVLEAHAGPTLKVGETLPPSLAPLLAHLGLDALLAGDGHLRSQGNRSLWGSATPADSPFLANPYGAGWHVDRRLFEARLAAAAQDAGAAWFWGCRVRRVRGEPGEGGEPGDRGGVGERAGSRWLLDLADGRTLEADFLADATGRPAHFARRRGGARRLRYDRLVGISTLLPAAGPAAAAGSGSVAASGPAPAGAPAVDSYTLVEAVDEGWWYSAPLADGRLAVALMGDGDLLDRALFGRGAADAWWRRLSGADATRRRVEAHGVSAAWLGAGARFAAPAGVAGSASPARPLDFADRASVVGSSRSADFAGRADFAARADFAGRADGAGHVSSAAARGPGGPTGAAPPPLSVQPAESSRLDRIVGDGWIALGDAAAAYDPLSSHGVVAAMGSGFYGGHAIADLLAGREEAGDAYLDVMQRTYGGYLDLLRERYAAERRFPGSPFWRRRQAAGFADLPL